jgi:N-acyl-L-homoserine lactone synthetase
MEDGARFPDGMERDEFDEDAVQILGWDGPAPIATCRLIIPAPDRPLPLQKTFGEMRNASQLVEWGRVSVDASLRGRGALIFMGLAARAWLSMRSRGFSTAIGVTPPRLLALFRALGFPVMVVGEARIHWGIERIPFLCTGSTAVQMLEHLWSVREGGTGEPPDDATPSAGTD